MSQELVRKLIHDSVPKTCVLDPIPTTFLKTYLDDFHWQYCERITDVWVCSFAVERGSRDPTSEEKKKKKKRAPPPPPPKKKKKKKLALTHSFKNYRPVSNLQFLSKLPKKAVLHQLRSLFSELELTLP